MCCCHVYQCILAWMAQLALRSFCYWDCKKHLTVHGRAVARWGKVRSFVGSQSGGWPNATSARLQGTLRVLGRAREGTMVRSHTLTRLPIPLGQARVTGIGISPVPPSALLWETPATISVCPVVDCLHQWQNERRNHAMLRCTGNTAHSLFSSSLHVWSTSVRSS